MTWQRAGTAGIVVAVMIAVIIGWLSLVPPPQPEILDGLSVGGPAACGACIEPDTSANCGACEGIARLASRHVDETWPGHPEIATMFFFGEGWYPGPSGEKILHTRSGALVVAVATFVDGTRHAVSVYCGVGACR